MALMWRLLPWMLSAEPPHPARHAFRKAQIHGLIDRTAWHCCGDRGICCDEECYLQSCDEEHARFIKASYASAAPGATFAAPSVAGAANGSCDHHRH